MLLSIIDKEAVTDVIDDAVINRPFESSFSKKKTMRQYHKQHSIYALIEHIILNQQKMR